MKTFLRSRMQFRGLSVFFGEEEITGYFGNKNKLWIDNSY
jgi:hypothetical protein